MSERAGSEMSGGISPERQTAAIQPERSSHDPRLVETLNTPAAARRPRWAWQHFPISPFFGGVGVTNLVTPWFVLAWGRTEIAGYGWRCAIYAR